jgi:hypothetical protein
MTVNMPLLYQNALAQYESPIAQKAWLWYAERHDSSKMKYLADTYAEEVERLVSFLDVALPASAEVLSESIHTPHHDREVLDDLTRFILKRHANWRLGGNAKLWWEE